MKVEKWYDIGCMKCGKHLSTDFHYGMRSTRESALKCAKECGFKFSLLEYAEKETIELIKTK